MRKSGKVGGYDGKGWGGQQQEEATAGRKEKKFKREEWKKARKKDTLSLVFIYSLLPGPPFYATRSNPAIYVHTKHAFHCPSARDDLRPRFGIIYIMKGKDAGRGGIGLYRKVMSATQNQKEKKRKKKKKINHEPPTTN